MKAAAVRKPPRTCTRLQRALSSRAMTRPAVPDDAPAASPALGPDSSRLRWLVVLLAVGGAGCLAAISLASPGATRMYSWPWSLAWLGAVALPALLLAVRAFEPVRPLALPSRPWLALALVSTVVVLASALASPHRETSLLWSAPLLAGVAVFLVVFDGLQRCAENGERNGRLLEQLLLGFFLVLAVASIGLWLERLPRLSGREVFDARNPFTLGHSNYTAGLALLMLPTAATLAVRRRGRWRAAAVGVAGLALVMLFTSGSRGGLLGLAAMTGAALVVSPLDRRRKTQLFALAILAGLAFTIAHPRTRAVFQRAEPASVPNISNVQREAMVFAGLRMGADRPLLGWGPGTTPLVYPRYRAGLAGGAENVLQLHSLPVQLWAELGAAGLAGLFAFGLLAARAAARARVAAVTLAGYGVFALTDWQLDVPLFATLAAVFAARLAARAAPPKSNLLGYSLAGPARRVVGGLALAGVVVVAGFGRRDPAPELNVRALALAREPGQADRAIALLRASLALNPAQEIAHFNLGWLLLVREPAEAGRHFAAAAQLVPDKGGVYFGLGLARLNEGRRSDAAEAFALECLNDPRFLFSPWWGEPAIGATREATALAFARALARARTLLPEDTWAADQLAAVAEAGLRLGQVAPGPEHSHRRERTGYPVLMRNLDLPPPLDLFDVREFAHRPADASAAGLPPKGWLPSPLLLKLLEPAGSAGIAPPP